MLYILHENYLRFSIFAFVLDAFLNLIQSGLTPHLRHWISLSPKVKKPEDVRYRTDTGRQRGSISSDLSNNLYVGMSMPKSYSSMNVPRAKILYFGSAR